MAKVPRSGRQTGRQIRGTLLAAAAILAVAAPVRATPFDATLSFSVFLGPVSSGSASFLASGIAGNAGAGFSLPSGLFAGTAAVPVTTPSGLTRLSFTVLGNGMGNFVSFGVGGIGGKMPIYGGAFAIGSGGAGPETLVSVPLNKKGAGVGVGGFATVPGAFVDFDAWLSKASLVFVPWGKNVYQYTFHQLNSMIFQSNATWTSVPGSDSRTPGGLGHLTLVSPTVVQTSLGAQGTFLVVASLTLNFVPEPGTLLLCGFGVAALAALGARSRRRP